MSRYPGILFIAAQFMLASGAQAVNIDITFTPNDTISIAEGDTMSASVTFDDTDVNGAPFAFYEDTTGFAAASYDTVRQGPDHWTRINFFLSPEFTDDGSHYGIDFTAIDTSLSDTSATLFIAVTNSPRAPQIVNLPDTIYVDEGGSTDFAVVAIDPDNNIRAHRISPSNVGWVTIDSASGLIDIGPVPFSAADWQDTESVWEFTITVVDNNNLSDQEAFTIIVHNVDRPPYFTHPSRDTVITILQQSTFNLTLRAVEPDVSEGDSVLFFDVDGMISDLQAAGWTASFNDSLISVTPPTFFEGLAGDVGFRFAAARAPGAPGDTISLNFFVVDNTSPESPPGLAADSLGQTFGAIRMQWTAPHEDGNAGGAVASYLIRFSTTAPGGDPVAWWNAAQNIAEQPPVPQAPGSNQSLIIRGFREYQSYWLGIRAVDSSENVSAVAVTGAEQSRHVRPALSFLGDLPDTVRADSTLYFEGVASDSGGILTAIRYSAGSSPWSPVAIDSTRDSSSVFIRKFFHFSGPAGTDDSLDIRVRAFDTQDSITATKRVYIDNVRPGQPAVISDPLDSLTNDNSFEFDGTKDSDAIIWLLLTLGQNPGTPIRVTAPGDNSTSWQYSEVVYYQGSVSFSFYASDNAGNISDTTTLNFWLVLSQEPPNIIDPDSVDYHQSLIFNPAADSFYITFPYRLISQFDLTILNQLGTVVYGAQDSLAPAPGRYTAGWTGMMNRGPNAGSPAPDGRYLARFSARIYPVSPYDIPIEVELVLDSYAPFEMEFFPIAGVDRENPRIISRDTEIILTVGDSGAVGTNARAAIITPRLIPESGPGFIDFAPDDSIAGRWIASLGQFDNSQDGVIAMTLVIADEALNETRYVKYYELTSQREITGFLNYPNPFAPSAEETRITYTLGRAVSDLTLEIYDSSGDVVFRTKLEGAFLTPQTHEFMWDGYSLWGKLLNNGIYFARLSGEITTDFLKIAISDR